MFGSARVGPATDLTPVGLTGYQSRGAWVTGSLAMACDCMHPVNGCPGGSSWGFTARGPGQRPRAAPPASRLGPEVDLPGLAIEDPPGAHGFRPGRGVRLLGRQRDQDVQRVGVEGEPEVGRRRDGRRVGVAVDDRPEDLVRVVGRDREPQQVVGVDLVAIAATRPGCGSARSGGPGRRRPPGGRRRSGRTPRSGLAGAGMGDDGVADRRRQARRRRARVGAPPLTTS